MVEGMSYLTCFICGDSSPKECLTPLFFNPGSEVEIL